MPLAPWDPKWFGGKFSKFQGSGYTHTSSSILLALHLSGKGHEMLGPFEEGIPNLVSCFSLSGRQNFPVSFPPLYVPPKKNLSVALLALTSFPNVAIVRHHSWPCTGTRL